MSLKYPMERLGPVGFQDCAAALALRVFGAHLHPLGSGRDRGRDMITDERVQWSNDVSWYGTTVFQMKHKATLTAPSSDAAWLWGEIRKELNTWASPDSGRVVPNQLVFVTNVPLTPAEGGTFDGLRKHIREWISNLDDESADSFLTPADRKVARQERQIRRDRMSALRAWDVLDRTYLERTLDGQRDVRLAFDGFMQMGDVLADLSRFAAVLSEGELVPALKQHSRWALTNERKIHFDEAGADQKGFPIEEVVIDLPVRVKTSETKAKIIQYVLDRGDHMLKPTLTSLKKPRHLVVVGAPGNGKTTVSKFIVHAYRAAWLNEDPDLGEEHRRTVAATLNALQKMGQSGPANRRWPLRVDLAQFAVAKATDPHYTLLTYIAETLSAQAAAKPLTKGVLAPWLRTWPSLLLLDGLDEVAEPRVRKGLIADVEAFVDEAESSDCDMLVVVTTRPTGYVDELSPSVFERVDLADLSIEDALRYGRLVTQVRVPDEEVRRNGILALLESAAREESLQRLLRTPLQVLIMSIIAESAKRFAPSRFELFWNYYTTIEQRERGKSIVGLAGLIRDYPDEVLDLHCRAGLLLQQQAETAAGAESVLAPAELRHVAWQVLADAGHEPSGRDRDLLDRIVTATTHRLVLLTPRPSGGFGFDVRSLQELMAARALTTGPVEATVQSLKAIGASPHWRNTLLFALGRYFSERQPHEKDAATRLILTVDDQAAERMGSVFPVGPNLAAEVMDDGMASEPIYLHRIVRHALLALHSPEMYNRQGFARMLMVAAARSDAVRGLIADGLREALSSTRVARQNAEEVQRDIRTLGTEPEASFEVLGLATVRRDHSKPWPAEPVADWDAFKSDLFALAEQRTEPVLADIFDLFQKVSTSGLSKAVALRLSVYLADAEVAGIVDLALAHIAEAEPLLISSLRHSVLPDIWRKQPAMSGGG